jgi:hypothetical protein
MNVFPIRGTTFMFALTQVKQFHKQRKRRRVTFLNGTWISLASTVSTHYTALEPGTDVIIF